MGKLSSENLKKMLACVRKDPRIIVPPWPGYDSGVHRFDNDRYLVVSTDPCIGAPEEWFGWLLIHYAASDVALFGAKPEYCALDILGPPDTAPEEFFRAMKQACEAADELDMLVVTGHTGTYNGLAQLLGVCTAYGTVRKASLVTPDGAKPGDYILVTKPIGLETVVNFASVRNAKAQEWFGPMRTKELAGLVRMQTCVSEALLLAKMGGTHALHDVTEGGLVAALNEMADNSKTGFHIEYEQVPYAEETYLLRDHFNLSENEFLSISSTGSLLAALDAKAKEATQKRLQEIGVVARIVGVFTESPDRLLVKKGKETDFPREAMDPYNRILSGKV